jgi:flagellar hook-associated protein 2
MAIASQGIGSGLDVNSIIATLMAVERQPLTTLTTQQTGYNDKISSIGKVKSGIASLQSAAAAISSSSKIYSYKGILTDTSIASATTTSSAVAGTYSIEVERLAGTHKLLSAIATDTSVAADLLAGGTLTIELGSATAGTPGSFVAKSGTSPVAVTIAAGSTLANVRDAINSADAGVSATIVNGASGQQLVLTSKSSGETSQMRLSGMSAFSFDPTTVVQTGKLTEKDAGQNAILKVDGIVIADATSNTVTDAITGLTLNLTKTNLGSPTQLTVSIDTSSLKTKLEAFVKAYNDINSTIKDLTKYDATTKKGGSLNGDQTISSVTTQLRNTLFNVPSGASSNYQYLSDLGINFQSKDGSLVLDSTILQTAIDKNFSAVAATVAAYGTAVSTVATAMNATDGLISTRTEGVNASLTRLGARIDKLNASLVQVEKRYRAQFTSLDVLMSKLSKTSNYLTQQLASLNNSKN